MGVGLGAETQLIKRYKTVICVEGLDAEPELSGDQQLWLNS